MAFLDLYYHKKVNEALKRYYLSLPGCTEQDWDSRIASDSRSFNLVWRSALRRIYPLLELNDQPPPVSMRRISDFSGREQTAFTGRQQLAVR